MPYATVIDLQDRLGEPRLVQLTDLADPPLGLVDTAVAQKALDDADRLIDGHLAGRYSLPLATVPGVLTVHALAIAHYRLLGSAATETDRKDYEDALRYLGMVAKGDIALLPPAQAEAPAGAGLVQFVVGAKVMGREE